MHEVLNELLIEIHVGDAVLPKFLAGMYIYLNCKQYVVKLSCNHW